MKGVGIILDFMKNLLSAAKSAKNKGDAVKELKKSAKGAAKSKIKIWIWAGIGSFFLNIIIPIIIVATMLIPFSFAYQMLQKIGDEIADGTLKFKSKTWDTWMNFLSDGENGEEYEEYLIATYQKIDKKIQEAKKKEAEGNPDENFNENDLYNKSAAAIGWVYSRIYSATMEPNTTDDWFNLTMSLFGSAQRTKQGAVLKQLDETVVDIYDPNSSDADYLDVAELRLKVFNEVITPYDIQAFDYVGGTLFDLLNLDIKELRDSIAKNYEKEITTELDEANREIYEKSIKRILELNKELVDEAFLNTNWTLLPWVNDQSANQYLKNIKNSFRFSFEDTHEGVSWQIFNNSKLSGDNKQIVTDAFQVINKIYTAEGGNTAKKIEAIEVTKEDYDILMKAATNMKAILLSYVDSQSKLSSTEKTRIKELVGNIHDTKTVDYGTYPKLINELKTKTAEDVAVKEVEINKEITQDEFDEKLIKKIKDLKLGRTWQVAETFRDALLELDDSGQVAEYYSLSFGDESDTSSLRYKLLTLNSPLIISKDDKLQLSGVPIFLNFDAALSGMSIGKDSNYKYDANGNLIVAGISSGTNFITGEIGEIVSKMKSFLESYKISSEEKIKESLTELKESALAEHQEKINNNKNMIKIAYEVDFANISSTLKSAGKFQEVYNASINETVTKDLISSARQGFYSSAEYLNLSVPQLTSVLLFYSSAETIADSDSVKEGINSNYESYVSEITASMNEQIQALLDEVAKIPTEGEYYKNETYYVPSDITEVSQAGYTKKLKSIGSSNNILKIQKYKNTIKEAVMKTAQKCYPEKVRELSGQSGGISGTINLEDIEIGSAVNGQEYQNAYRYIDYFIKYGNMYGVDPYLLLAKAAQESSGDHDSHLNSDAGYGLMQIESPGVIKTGVTAYNYETKQDEYMAIPNKAAVSSVENNIKAGAMIFANSIKGADYNILVGIQGYNYGIETAKTAVKLYAEEVGKTYEELISSYSDLGWRKYIMLIHLDINSYVQLAKPWTQGTYGDPLYINNVLRYYNPSDSGGPWVLNESGDKIQLIASESGNSNSSDKNNSTNDTDKYFKGKELISWKEYYTDTKVFEEIDKWATEGGSSVPKNELTTSLSDTIITSIQKYASNPEIMTKISGLLNDSGTLANLIAKTYYIETGFKPEALTVKSIDEDIKTIGDTYISLLSDVASLSEDGVDLSFLIYLYSTDEDKRDVAKKEILTGDKNFDKFIKETYLKDKESLTSSDELLTKVVRIITGDKNAKVDSYFNISSGESSSTGKIVDGRLKFYKEWLDAKNTFHEMFNAEIDEKIGRTTDEDKIQKLKDMKLPVDFTFDGAIADDSSTNVKDGLVGKLSLDSDGKNKVNELMVFKKDLTNTDNYSNSKNEPKYIVIHQASDTTGGASAKNQYDVYNGDRKSETHKSVHFTVDSSSVYQWIDVDKSAIHIESNAKDVSNSNSIAIEYVATNGKVSDQLQWNMVALCKYLMHKYPTIAEVRIVTHSSITEGECPDIMTEKSNKIYNQFIQKFFTEGNLTFKYEEVSQYSGDVAKLIEEAMKHLGKPYVWGGKGPNGFDCSGFVQYVFATALGKSVPAPTWTQMTLGVEVQRADLKPGDLIFFRGGDHVAIYIGEYEGVDSYIHAGGPTSGPNPTAQDKVMIYPMTRDTMTSFRRIL